MRNSPGPLLRRVMAGCSALAALCVPGGLATAAPGGPAADPPGFTERYQALRHGGIVRAANSSITCRAAAALPAADPCLAARAGRDAANDDFDMAYIDVDDDPNTYNSSRAHLDLPQGARVAYARLYWGGNLRAGEQKPPADNGRVLFAEPGGSYRAVLADTVARHTPDQGAAGGADAFQASADVTALVRSSGPGLYTVAQVNVAMGRSAAGAWGGWTLVVAYEKESEPLRRLALWDGFTALAPVEERGRKRGGPDAGQTVRLPLAFPAGAGGQVGLVAYDGDRGRDGDSLTVSAGGGAATALSGAAGSADDVLDSTIGGPGAQPWRIPAYENTLGYDSDVLDLAPALRSGGDGLAFRLASRQDAVWFGALFAAVDATR
ncbi:DUF3344 domain-containing protein [Streptomyces sp. NPDC008313]|uniref:DUF3344 domain-containing protein n=1 Tax=Streptomyces sp. NPDC008313 TaxID=3364826 RepID=UPI0036EB9517